MTQHKLKDIYLSYQAAFNSRDFDSIRPMLTDDVGMKVFNSSTGEYGEFFGKEQIMQILMSNVGRASDLQDVTDKFIEGDNELCVVGTAQGTTWGSYSDGSLFQYPEGFKVPVIILVSFDNGRIKYFDFHYDTFELMRLRGTAVLDTEDQELINRYLHVLVEGNIINKDVLKDN